MQKILDCREAQEIIIALNSLTTLEKVSAKLPEGAKLTNIIVSVDDACVTGTTLSIGISSAKTKFVNAQSIAAVGATHKPQYYVGAKNGEDIYFKFNQASTTGVVTVLLEYYTKNNYVSQY